MKKFIIDFIISFLIIIGISGISGSIENNDYHENYDEVIIDKNEEIENIKDYDGNLVNRISFKFNSLIQNVADFGFDIFKKALKSFLD